MLKKKKMSIIKRNEEPADKGRLLKMKELCQAAGVSKATVIHYVNEGLLPKPLKTSPNMAYYHPSCVERLIFIKQVQAKRRLPLAAIKRLLKERDAGRDITTLLELQEYIFGLGKKRLTREQFEKAAGLTGEQVSEYLEAGLLIPLMDDHFDPEDVAVGKALKDSRQYGLTAAKAAFYNDLAREIVEAEMALRWSLTADLPHEEDARATMTIIRTARALRSYVIDRVLQRRLIKIKGLKDNEKK